MAGRRTSWPQFVLDAVEDAGHQQPEAYGAGDADHQPEHVVDVHLVIGGVGQGPLPVTQAIALGQGDGLGNWQWALTDPSNHQMYINNVLWLVVRVGRT